jgi:predicted phosphodiesterase
MKIQIYSDLHLEFSEFVPSSIDADLVVLAGDIGVQAKGVKWANEAFQCPVIYVCGNHEFYKGHIDRTLTKMRDQADSHVHILENEAFVWQQTRFLGTTTWTDFSSTGDVVAATSLAREWMNDFKVIRADASYRRLRPDDLVTRNQLARAWLAEELAKPFAGKTVVTVAGDKHDGHLNAAYSNHWPELIEQADVWIFGHTHQAVDTTLSGCRILSNPRGYPREETGFRADFTIDLQ